MAQATNYKRTLGGSIGAGMKSVMGGDRRRYFILEHKVSSKYHKAGENQKIIVDQIEIGRDPKAQVRFDESFNTVSRKHAAIVRDGDNWKLIPLSQTNSTYLNGHKVDKEWYLQNGDEIQLSTNGPKLGFITPAGDKGLVKSIGMTARLNLFRKQALKPYKTALACVGGILVIAVTLGTIFLAREHEENDKLKGIVAEQSELIDQHKQLVDSISDATATQLAQAKVEKDALVKRINTMQGQMSNLQNQQRNISVGTQGLNGDALTQAANYTYFVMPTAIEVTLKDGKSATFEPGKDDAPSWVGTGFLLEDGKFVTARHVVQPWFYWLDGDGINEALAQLNQIVNDGGKVKVYYTAFASSGDRISFNSDQFSVNKSGDEVGRLENGVKLSLAQQNNLDYAYVKTGKHGGLSYNKNLSNTLHRGDKLALLGFPGGYGAYSPSSINPISSTVTVGVDNLDHGLILTSETNMDHGNSGGPAMILGEDGKYVVVGIASAMTGKNLGFIVPVSVIR